MMTTFPCVSARFKFWNGKHEYTVEYNYGISMWFVFNNEETTDCVYKKEDKKIPFNKINMYSAANILVDFIDSKNKSTN